MRRIWDALWRQGVVGTFLSGLFAVLPLALTVALIVWVVRFLESWLGPHSAFGQFLRSIGLTFVTDDTTALIAGLALVLVGIWLLGWMVKARARHRFDEALNSLIERIPLVKSVYRTMSQLVAIFNRDADSELKGLTVVFVRFGEQGGCGFLALLASPDRFRFDGREYHLVYLPTAPVPMSGGVMCVPAEQVVRVEMSVDALMQLYLSMGMLAGQSVPEAYRTDTA